MNDNKTPKLEDQNDEHLKKTKKDAEELPQNGILRTIIDDIDGI